MPGSKFMQLAIDKAIANRTPFGACIVRNGRVIGLVANREASSHDPTEHAEVTAIRLTCRRLKNRDLSGAMIYSTFEPCLMCMSAIYWANIRSVVCGGTLADSKGFDHKELDSKGAAQKIAFGKTMKIKRGFMREECLELFKWARRLERS